MVYSTYFGNSGTTDDWGAAIAVDSTGAAYVTGVTGGGLTTLSAAQASYGGSVDGFVTKINAAGSAPVYTTYLGGNGSDEAFGIAVDSSGLAYVTGRTYSSNFPTSNAKQSAKAAPTYYYDAFVTKYLANGSGYTYSTYLGGASGDTEGHGIAVDGLGSAYVVGLTSTSDFPVQNAAQPASGLGYHDAFVTAYTPSGATFLYSTYLGGSGQDDGYSIASDSAGNIVVGGDTSSLNFPVSPPARGMRQLRCLE